MMNVKNSIGIAIFILLTVNVVSGQNLEEKYKERLKVLKEKDNNRSGDMVINVKMIERFYSVYDEVEVLPWKEILLEDNFEHVRASFTAYNSLEFHEIDPLELQQALRLKTDEIRDKQKGELPRNESLAIIEE